MTDCTEYGSNIQADMLYEYDVQKSTLKIWETFLQKTAKPFWKNARSQLEKARIESTISFHRPGWNSKQNGNVQLFCYINSIAYFLSPFEEKDVRSPMEKGRIEFSITFHQPGWNFVQNDIFIYFDT